MVVISSAEGSPGSKKPARVTVGEVAVDRLTMDDAVQWVVDSLRKRTTPSPLLIVASNAQVVTLAADLRLMQALRSAQLVVPDGISVVLASRLLGCPTPERVPGGELMERLCAEFSRRDLSVFFLGGLPAAADGAARQLIRRYPGLRIVGCYCPQVGFEDQPAEAAMVRGLIAKAAPDLLCVALGVPKQEIWMRENCLTLPIGAAIGVGAALDTTAGLRKRAPRWTQRIGMEWLYRLIREPRRLWRRYLIGNTQFVVLIALQLTRQWTTSHRATREQH